MGTGRTGKLGKEEADAVLELGISLGANIQGIVQDWEVNLQEKEGGLEDGEDEEEADVEDQEDESRMDWGEVELDDADVTLDETVEDLSEEPEDEESYNVIDLEKEEEETSLDAGSDVRSLTWWREKVVELQKEADDDCMVVEDDQLDVDHDEVGECGDDEEEEEVDDEQGESAATNQSAIHTMIDTFINSVRDPGRDLSKEKVVAKVDENKDDELETMPPKSNTNQENFEVNTVSVESVRKDDQSHETAATATSPKRVGKNKGGLFNCPLCLFIVAKKANLRDHMSTAHYLSILLTKYCRQGLKLFEILILLDTKNIFQVTSVAPCVKRCSSSKLNLRNTLERHTRS